MDEAEQAEVHDMIREFKMKENESLKTRLSLGGAGWNQRGKIACAPCRPTF